MDIIERLDAAIKTEDFWVGDQREDNILKDSKKIIEQLREALQPFAKVLKGNWSHQSNEMLMSFGFGEDKRLELTLGDFRNASAALKENENEQH